MESQVSSIAIKIKKFLRNFEETYYYKLSAIGLGPQDWAELKEFCTGNLTIRPVEFCGVKLFLIPYGRGIVPLIDVAEEGVGVQKFGANSEG